LIEFALSTFETGQLRRGFEPGGHARGQAPNERTQCLCLLRHRRPFPDHVAGCFAQQGHDRGFLAAGNFALTRRTISHLRGGRKQGIFLA